jgi:hypothetical protein
MTYIDEITGALVRVLTHACDGPPHRFAGYAANAEFWIDEARHCLDVIDGYKHRFSKMRAVTREHSDSPSVGYGSSSVLTTKTSTSSDLTAARRQLFDAVARFLRRCEKTQALEQDAIIRFCAKVGIPFPP